jgi:vacuolar-type H+-ATPase subunit H
MRNILIAGLGAATLALAACGGSGDDSLGDNAADAAENQADMLEEQAENATSEVQEDQLEAQADAVEDAGEAREEAIDDADVNADAMTPAQEGAAVNGM